jgi:hypothetical protein
MSTATNAEALDLAPDHPWRVHVVYMLETYGRRDPECVHCGERVWMALQGFCSGGTFTTDRAAEGPTSDGLNDPGTRCPRSPDGRHDTELTNSWRRKREVAT